LWCGVDFVREPIGLVDRLARPERKSEHCGVLERHKIEAAENI